MSKAKRYANKRTRVGDTPDDGPDFDGMTFQQFQATGRDVDDLREVDPDHFGDYDYIVNGRVYCDRLWTVPCVTSGIGWCTIIGNCEFQHGNLELIELKLYHFAVSEGIAR